jgi:hypothetical protein
MMAMKMDLSPYAAQVRFAAEKALSERQWRSHLAEFLERIARTCDAHGPSVIGHIKALALFDDRRYLRGSVVSPHHPADVEGNPPEAFLQMDITLNVLVYGPERPLIETLVAGVVSEIGQSFSGSITILPIGET